MYKVYVKVDLLFFSKKNHTTELFKKNEEFFQFHLIVYLLLPKSISTEIGGTENIYYQYIRNFKTQGDA